VEERQRQINPQNLDDAFDMVGNQQVFKTPSTNVAVAMANLERLPNMPEYQDVRTNIRAHLIAAIGQTTELIKQAQAISHAPATSGRSHQSRISPPLGGSRRNRSPPRDAHQGNSGDHHNQEAYRNGRNRDAHQRRRAHEPNRGYNQEANQRVDYDLRHNLPPWDIRDHINKRIKARAAHENIQCIEYDTTHGPPGLKQFTPHL